MEWIKTTQALEDACKALSAHDFVALDTEFMRESTFWPKLCLIQAAAGDRELLIDPLEADLDLSAFFGLLADESVTKVFHACRQDLEIFHMLGGGLIPSPIFDTQIAAMAVGLGDSISYDNLVRALLKQNVDKGSRFTDWSRRPLSNKQAAYALADVTHLRDLYPMLRDRLGELGREHWLAEEMRTLTDPRTYESHPEEAWRRLKLRKTTPQWLAALKAAAEWREREAQTRDIPRNRVMKDDALYEIAQAAPRSPEALGELRAVPRGFERSSAAARLIENLNEALRDPKAYAPKVEKRQPPPSNLGPVVEMLKVFLKMVAEEAGVASRLIANVADLERIAESDEADVPALRGWRRDVFGEAALKLKRGEIALSVENGRVVAEER